MIWPDITPKRNRAAGKRLSNCIIFRRNFNLLTLLYSSFLAISCLSGCSTQKYEHQTIGNPLLERSQILNKYAVITDFRRSDYLAKISTKLSGAAGLSAPIDITILATDTPLALSISNGDIFISSGLIHELRDEESFVFILAHELAHTLLEHHRAQNPNPSFELAADSLGLNIILKAGYPAQSVYPTLVNSYPLEGVTRQDSVTSVFGINKLAHPPLTERIKNLNETLMRFDLTTTGVQEIAYGYDSEDYFQFSARL